MTGRRLPVVAGLLLFGVALFEMAVPGAVPLPVPIGRSAVYVVGGLVLVYAYFVLEATGKAEFRRAETPDPEVPVSTPPPGDDLTDALGQFRGTDSGYGARIEDGLRAAAIAVLTRYEGCSESEAERRIEDGTWTPDRYAAAFLSDRGRASVPLTARLRGGLSADSFYRRSLRHTVDAIADVAGVPAPETDGGSGLRRWLPGRSGSASSGPPEVGAVDTEGDRPLEAGVLARRATNHWVGVSLVALVGLGVGLLVERPAVLLAGIVGVGYAAYARSSSPGVARLSVERSIAEEAPAPGDDVEVTVTVTNEGSRLLPDLRVVDGVPEALAVTDGSPRCGTALRPGSSRSVSYTVTARRGRHEFRPTLALVGDLPGSFERETYVAAAGDSVLTCVPSLRPARAAVPLRPLTARYTGAVPTDTGGEGVEFYATRQYRPGDAMNRIDWHRRARTGELATLQFREERAARVVLVIDAQRSAYRSPEPYADHAVERSVEAARRVFARLLDDGHRVGIAALGPEECWLPPGAGEDHRLRGRRLLATDPAFSPVPREATDHPIRWRRRLRRRLPADVQVILFSPLCDQLTARTARQLDAGGRPATVVSPDPTTNRTLGQRLMRVRWTVRITDLRGAGIPVIDWPADESLAEALAAVRDGPIG